ncbi:MAG: hypothetical protein M1818_005277 [Claussenomyces sp. TS43310]|nr:MAG: hypothetical protein M1818_005277 [Claussenomyces sp. TS43310]
MSWFSILPASISFIETWAIRIFLLLGAIAIAPWLLLIVYDMILYLFRTVTYDIPVIGGRARNRPRPRAPSLSERPSGRLRNLTIPTFATPPEAVAADAIEGLKHRLEEPVHTRKTSNAPIDDE